MPLKTDTASDSKDAAILGTSVTLPSGLVLPNRFVKAAMAEDLSAEKDGHQPNKLHASVYREWGNGGWGLLITGNVQVDPTHRGSLGDTTVEEADLTNPASLQRWETWAKACKGDGAVPTPTIVQLCHTGRQSPRGAGRSVFTPNKSASDVRLEFGPGIVNELASKIVFGTPKAMSEQEVQQVVAQFAVGAQMCHLAGFAGVQLHAAHGYLLAQFMSPKTNLRKDRYGFHNPTKGLQLLFEIIDRIREKLPRHFTISIKLNSKDYVDGGLTEEDALEQVRMIIAHGGVDFIEISGGTYEAPRMLSALDVEKPLNSNGSPKPVKPREAFFTNFSRKAREAFPEYIFMVTGGFRDRVVMAEAVSSNACQLIGLGRPAALYPDLPRRLLQEGVEGFSLTRVPPYRVKGIAIYEKILSFGPVGTGLMTMWHQWQIAALAVGEKPNPDRSVTEFILHLNKGPLTKLFLLGVLAILVSLVWRSIL
ncbi:FMN binding oxidoreductase [Fimicolochytrium jonesii]|uniref:FMN binding oxidoreductase n=1 Tax=Fimicolochytrium jonesii TaxID=1396493 RepID=UPI0022FEFC8C|nr:FMN binding oxidoreductase [Fimicolochytrium jonesii]KAI8816742.1 FMN binding oxidoreductase [Fimicolochytrium jonesii]